jgi:hypothetical protein
MQTPSKLRLFIVSATLVKGSVFERISEHIASLFDNGVRKVVADPLRVDTTFGVFICVFTFRLGLAAVR